MQTLTDADTDIYKLTQIHSHSNTYKITHKQLFVFLSLFFHICMSTCSCVLMNMTHTNTHMYRHTLTQKCMLTTTPIQRHTHTKTTYTHPHTTIHMNICIQKHTNSQNKKKLNNILSICGHIRTCTKVCK